MELYAIRDIKMLNYNHPVPARNKGVLIRDLTEVVNTKDHQYNKHPSDFELYQIGTFDENSGIIKGFEQPEIVLTLSELKGDD